FRAHNKQVVFIKKSNEKTTHVLLKAFLWALYLPSYPNLRVEVKIGDRYKPDVVSLDSEKSPEFWGEAGQISPEKIRSLVRRYRHTHFAIAKWVTSLDPLEAIVSDALNEFPRDTPFDLIAFPDDSAERFIDSQGQVIVDFDDIVWKRFSRDN
ncbi:MAG: hypothetical protein AAF485_24845, partial [Chloroflexota bacterium]